MRKAKGYAPEERRQAIDRVSGRRELPVYAIASCYNGLSNGGGGYTLPRLRLYECALDARSPEDFLERELPRHIDLQLEYMDKRVRFIVE